MAPRHASAAPDLVGRGALVVREAPVLGSTAGLGALLAVTIRFKISPPEFTQNFFSRGVRFRTPISDPASKIGL